MKQAYSLKTGAELLALGIDKGKFERSNGKAPKHIRAKTKYVVGFDSNMGAVPTANNINFFQPRSTFIRTLYGQVICDAEGF